MCWTTEGDHVVLINVFSFFVDEDPYTVEAFSLGVVMTGFLSHNREKNQKYAALFQ